MNTDARPDVLPPCALLASFDEADRQALTGHGRFLQFKAGQTIIREKERQDCLYFLIQGELRAVHQLKGGSAPVGTIRAGEWFGEINIFDPKAASAMVVAHIDSQVWSISRPKLEGFLNEKPDLGCLLLLGVGEVLARRTRELVAKLNATWELSW